MQMMQSQAKTNIIGLYIIKLTLKIKNNSDDKIAREEVKAEEQEYFRLGTLQHEVKYNS